MAEAEHATSPENACGWTPPPPYPGGPWSSFYCTRLAGHDDDCPSLGGHLMNRDTAVRWFGARRYW